MLSPSKTYKHKPIEGSLQINSPISLRTPRRSSAAGIRQGPNSNHSVDYRSHSVDGLFDVSSSNFTTPNHQRHIAEVAGVITAGTSQLSPVTSRYALQKDNDNSYGVIISTKEFEDGKLNEINKSRSLDHFLDEDNIAPTLFASKSVQSAQSMKNLGVFVFPKSKADDISRKFPTQQKNTDIKANSLLNSKHISSTRSRCHDNAYTANLLNSVPASTNRGKHNQQITTSSSVLDPSNGNFSIAASRNGNNKTILNRTLKKFRSLIKKKTPNNDQS